MNFQIRGENLPVTEALREYVEKKVGRIERYFDTDSPEPDVHVTMRVLRGEGTIEVTIPLVGVILRAEETHEDMYAAIDLVTEKLERQIRKYKTRVNRKMRQDASSRTIFRDPGTAASGEEEEIQIVRTKQFDLKPMDAEEAVLQMGLLGHNFFVYHDSSTNKVNVVYRRHDGKYGLIETK